MTDQRASRWTILAAVGAVLAAGGYSDRENISASLGLGDKVTASEGCAVGAAGFDENSSPRDGARTLDAQQVSPDLRVELNVDASVQPWFLVSGPDVKHIKLGGCAGYTDRGQVGPDVHRVDVTVGAPQTLTWAVRQGSTTWAGPVTLNLSSAGAADGILSGARFGNTTTGVNFSNLGQGRSTGRGGVAG